MFEYIILRVKVCTLHYTFFCLVMAYVAQFLSHCMHILHHVELETRSSCNDSVELSNKTKTKTKTIALPQNRFMVERMLLSYFHKGLIVLTKKKKWVRFRRKKITSGLILYFYILDDRRLGYIFSSFIFQLQLIHSSMTISSFLIVINLR